MYCVAHAENKRIPLQALREVVGLNADREAG
jgi:hypothetical protein